MKHVNRKSQRILRLLFAVLFLLILLPDRGRVNAETEARISRVTWDQEIREDIGDGRYLTENLGMNGVTRQSVLKTIRDNWTDGLDYSHAIYTRCGRDPGIAVNYKESQYSGYHLEGYGYNCSGFVASVLYFANGGTKQDAVSNMEELYLPLKQGRRYSSQLSFTDSSGWYYFFNGIQHTASGDSTVPKTKLYYAGETTDSASTQAQLTRMEKAGKLAEGDIIYFWPKNDTDCHVGIYAGKDENGVHRMYHALGKGMHNGISMESDVALTPVITDYDSWLYIVPLPEGKEYYLAVAKQQKQEGSMLNGVPFRVGVSPSGMPDTWTYITVRTGYYTNLYDGKTVKTGVHSTGGTDTSVIRFDGLRITPRDGYAYIYLGNYGSAPYVAVKESWIDETGEMVDPEGNVRTVTGSQFAHDRAWYTFLLNDGYTTLSGAADRVSEDLICWRSVDPVRADGTRKKETGYTTRIWKERQIVLLQRPKKEAVWMNISGSWYHYDAEGLLETGWKKIGNKWYYFKISGAMAASEYVHGYWLGAGGVWSWPHRASWKKDKDGWWYGDTSGWYAKNTACVIDGKKYYFDGKGYLIP